jgi:hypothetical protein
MRLQRADESSVFQTSFTSGARLICTTFSALPTWCGQAWRLRARLFLNPKPLLCCSRVLGYPVLSRVAGRAMALFSSAEGKAGRRALLFGLRQETTLELPALRCGNHLILSNYFPLQNLM